jgi:excisionase family DNA binding protein
MSELITLLTAKQLSRVLGVGEGTIRAWARSGAIPCYQLTPGSCLRFDQQEVRAALLRHPAESAALAAAGGPDPKGGTS